MRSLATITLSLLALPAAAAATPFPQSAPMTVAELDAERGGFALPGGLQVAIAVVTDTRIDGRLVLRSTYRLDEGAPALQAFGRNASGELVAVDAATAAVSSPDGVISLRGQGGGTTRVDLAANGTDVSHLLGRSIGSIVANTANNRAIDVSTTIDLNLRNATPDLVGSSLLRAEALALSATAALTR